MRTDGQADRHDKVNSRFSQFCERAEKYYITTAFVQHKQWFTVNSLFLNYEITHYIHFMEKCSSFIDIAICYNNVLITNTSTKFLGIIIENSLSWEAQTDHLISKLCTACC